MTKLKEGQKAPYFKLLDQFGSKVSSKDFLGKKLLVYFYPKADTPGCTLQACSIRDNYPALSRQDIYTVGISPDLPEAQHKFDIKYDLGFELLSDPDHKVARAYGAWGKKKSFGKTSEGVIRSAFLIDEDGRILKTWYRVKPQDTAFNALELLKAA